MASSRDGPFPRSGDVSHSGKAGAQLPQSASERAVEEAQRRAPQPSRVLSDSRVSNADDDSEVAELELRALTVEEQLEALTQQVQQLKVQKSTIQDSRVQLQEQLDAACRTLSRQQAARHGSEADSLVLEKPNRRWPGLGSEDYRLEKAQQVIDELQFKLQEAYCRTNEVRAEYEAQLKTIRTRSQKEKAELKQGVLEQVDFLVKKYRKLARDAVEVARRERRRSHEERGKTKEVVTTACKDFERELKERTKQALRDFQTLAQKAHDAAQRERNQLKGRCEQLERSMERERQSIEDRVVREAERRVTSHREALERCQATLEHERHLYDNLMTNVAEQVKAECQNYEKFMESAVSHLLRKHGVVLREDEVHDFLTAAHDEYTELQKQKEIIKRNLEASTSMTVRYGFQAFKPQANSSRKWCAAGESDGKAV